MKKIRKFGSKIAMILAASLLFVSCSQYDDNLSDGNRLQDKYSGEEIFKGLFFFQNNISENVPLLKTMKESLDKMKNHEDITLALTDISNTTVAFINKKHPNFFNELKTVLKSGNRFEIEEKLSKASSLIEQALFSSSKYNAALKFGKSIASNNELMNKIMDIDITSQTGQEQFNSLLKDYSKSYDTGKEIGVVTLVAAALAAVYAGILAVSIAIAAYSLVVKVAYWDPTEVMYEGNKIFKENSIKHEILINEIAHLYSINN